jgi:hypothetical protein
MVNPSTLKTYLGLETSRVSSPCCCRRFDTSRWLGIGDLLILKVESLVVVVVAVGCYGSGGGQSVDSMDEIECK